MKTTFYFFFILCAFTSLLQAQGLTASLADKGDLSCFGENDGYAIIDARGGRGPYSYELNYSGVYQTGRTFSELAAGSYKVRVMDGNFDYVDVAFDILEPQPLRIGVRDKEDVICHGRHTGAIDLAATGGNGGYEYAIDSAPFDTLSYFQSLSAGGHFFKLRDQNNCYTDSFIVIQATPPVITYTENRDDVSCHGFQDGSFTLVSTGGHGGYRYSLDSLSFNSLGAFNQLEGGTYRVFVLDSMQCESSIEVSISEPDSLIHQFQKQDLSCFGEKDGKLEFSVSGGKPPFSYTINDDSYFFNNRFIDLAAGSFLLRVKDANGCQSQLDSVIINQPEPLELSLEGTDISCKGMKDGSVRLEVMGGTVPYSVAWNDDPQLNKDEITAVGAGYHFVAVEDANGCKRSSFIELAEPAARIALVEDFVKESNCGLENGALGFIVVNGQAPFSFEWKDFPFFDSHTASGLASGEYTLSVRDSLGCRAEAFAFVPSSSEVRAAFYSSPQLEQKIIAGKTSIQFINGSEGANQYEWDFGDGLGTSMLVEPSYTYVNEGRYEIQLVAKNGIAGCEDTLRKVVEVVPDEILQLADAFSPNGDGVNDVFRIEGSGIERAELMVVDRWGRPIREVNLIGDGWDGRDSKGKWVSPGAYAYKLRVVFRSGFLLERAGKVSVLR